MKINKLLELLDKNISYQNIKKNNGCSEIVHLTEYLQKLRANSIAIVSMPEDKNKSEEILNRYLPKNIDPEEFVLITDNPISTDYSFLCGDLDSIRKELCDLFYPMPSGYQVFGVTGTNGKTSVVNMAVSILEKIGITAIGMGTVGINLGGKLIESESLNSTYPYTEIRRTIYENRSNSQSLITEVTSHALKQKRLGDLRFDNIFWTNFSQDHLDYHKSEEDYFSSKLMITDLSDKIYLPESEVDLRNRIKKAKPEYKVVEVFFKHLFENDVPDGFIKQNLSIAIQMVELMIKKPLDLNLGEYQEYLPEGRFQIIEKGDKVCIIDYAHTPDAIEKLLKEVKINFPKRKIIIIFGCGGDRDRSKRSPMGRVAIENSDFVIVTSDNPRSEKPQKIIDDILIGIKDSAKYLAIESREEAIKRGIDLSGKDSLVVIAGKGHEDYQEISSVKYPFKDVEVARKYL